MPQQRTIAIAVELNLPFQWHYFIYSGAQQYARQHKHMHFLIDEFPEYRMDRKRDDGRPYDGIIARVTRAMSNSARRNGVPLVNVWRSSPVKNVPLVTIDNAQSGRICAEHFLDRGFRRFGYLFREKHLTDLEEVQAFKNRVEEQGLSCSTLPIGNGDIEDARSWGIMQDTIFNWLKACEPPVGIYVPQGNLSRHVVHLCNNLGWSVPLDVAIICGENESIFCENPAPSLTSIERNFDKVGYEAARLVDRLIDGAEAPDGPIMIPPQGIVPRNSTDFFAVDDELVSEALRFVNANLRQPLDVETIASAITTSSRTLQRRFLQCMNRSVAAEVRRLRIQLAKRMLAEPGHQVSQIARETGFGTANRMHDVFRRELGISPSEYRNQLLIYQDQSLLEA